MIQEIYQKAIKFAGDKHRNQKVPGTESNYLLHLSNVAMEVLVASKFVKFDLNLAIQLALLHDTIEDTSTTFEELKNEFGEEIAEGVRALTKDKNIVDKQERMIDSLDRINLLREEVGLVKLADRITNLQKPPKTWNKDKIFKYFEQSKIISDRLKDKNIYLNKRLDMKILEYKEFLQ